MDAIIGFEVIENAGPNHLRGFLKSYAKTATSIDIAVAFVSRQGLNEILPSLKKVSTIGPVRLVTGFYQGFTDPQALRPLLLQQSDTNGSLSVRISRNPHFHWKAYFLHRRRTTTAVIGSSNMTAEGLGQSGEINAVVTLRRSSAAFKSLHNHFEEEWKQATPLRRDLIDRYAKLRPKRVSQPSIPLKEILGNIQTRERLSKPGEAATATQQFWRDYVTGAVAGETEQVIADETNWEKRGYSWYSSREPRHRVGDEIALFDSNDNWVRLVRVVATTRTPTPTPDGRRFTAYKVITKTHKRRLGKPLLKKLVNEDILRKQSDAKQQRKLTPKTFAAICEILELR